MRGIYKRESCTGDKFKFVLSMSKTDITIGSKWSVPRILQVPNRRAWRQNREIKESGGAALAPLWLICPPCSSTVSVRSPIISLRILEVSEPCRPASVWYTRLGWKDKQRWNQPTLHANLIYRQESHCENACTSGSHGPCKTKLLPSSNRSLTTRSSTVGGGTICLTDGVSTTDAGNVCKLLY